MAENAKTTGTLLEVPEAQRHRIISGMRWTVWLSVLAIPFSYGTTVILARTSPEAVGTWGLLGVYIGLSLGIFYLGGDAVAIKFVPELEPDKRLSFLTSYFLVICAAVVPWVAVGALWPQALQHILGKEAGPRFELLLLALSPITMMNSLVSAALKGILEIGWAQMIFRLATITSFIVYGGLFLFLRPTLARDYPLIIWVVYLALCLGGAVAGFLRLWRACGWRYHWRRFRFFLPRGFWPYTLSLQQLSALSFVTSRLDVLLLLNFGGLALLGKYVAVITLAEAIRLISFYFIGTLLPSLTNTLADGNNAGASSAFHMHMRVIFFVCNAATCGLVLLARPVTALFGPKYDGLSTLIVLVAVLVGISTPGGAGGTLLSAISKQQRAVYVSLGQVAVYASLFAFLWPRYRLTGAVLAYGIGWAVSNPCLLLVARLSSPFRFSVIRDYATFALVATASVLVSLWVRPGLFSGLLGWILLVGSFPLLARYRLSECKALINCFVPVSRFSSPRSEHASAD